MTKEEAKQLAEDYCLYTLTEEDFEYAEKIGDKATIKVLRDWHLDYRAESEADGLASRHTDYLYYK